MYVTIKKVIVDGFVYHPVLVIVTHCVVLNFTCQCAVFSFVGGIASTARGFPIARVSHFESCVRECEKEREEGRRD